MPAVSGYFFLRDLALILGTAAVATVLFQRLRLPVIVGYLAAGMLVRPLITSPDTIRTLAELGVVLLLFSIGLEFRFRRLMTLGARVALAVVVEVGLMLLLGYGAARALGWAPLPSLLAAGIVAISSTMIAAGTLSDIQADRRFRDIVFGVLVMEDLAAVALIAVLTTLAAGGSLSGAELTGMLARLAVFLVVVAAAGMLVVPRAIREVTKLRRAETTLVAGLGVALGVAVLSYVAGYSVALGGFLAGALVAESGRHRLMAETIRPVRDLFAAVFFVAAGMLFDPAVLAATGGWAAAAVFVGVVLVGKTLGVTAGVFLAGYGTRDAIRSGMSLAQIGEFSFVIAGLAAVRGSAAGTLFPVAVAVATVTAFITPLLARRADRVAAWVDRKLPHPVQTAASLYSSWVELLVAPRSLPAPQARRKRLLRFLLLDAACVTAAIVGTSVAYRQLPAWLGQAGSAPTARLLALLVGGIVALPFAIGLVRAMHRLASSLGESALPLPARGVDQAHAPRQTLTTMLKIGMVIAVGFPITLLTLPFVPPFGVVGVVVAYLLVLAVAFWRTASNLDQHSRAGAELVVHVLARQAREGDTGMFEVVRGMLPGLGSIVPLEVQPGSEAAGKTLGELNLRGRTGATLVALSRGGARDPAPTSGTRIEAGDLVALTGSEPAIGLAAALLRARGTSLPPSGTVATVPPGA